MKPICDTLMPMKNRIEKEPYGTVSEMLVSMRLPADLVKRAKRLQRRHGTKDKPISRSVIFREALDIGLKALEKQRGRKR